MSAFDGAHAPFAKYWCHQKVYGVVDYVVIAADDNPSRTPPSSAAESEISANGLLLMCSASTDVIMYGSDLVHTDLMG